MDLEPLKVNLTHSFKMLVAACLVTQCHIREGQNGQLHYVKTSKTRTETYIIIAIIVRLD